MAPFRHSIPDARGKGASLRVTRHPEQGKVVLSHWREGVCVASTPIELSEVPVLIGVLADALGDAIDRPGAPAPKAETMTHHVVETIRSWLKPRLAQVAELRLVRDEKDDSPQQD
jgi:hypothetical protein